MPDLNGWPIACLALMALVITVNYLYEKGGDR